MPIVMTRTGEILQAPVLTQEQKDKAWEVLTRCWAQAHPEVFRQLQAKYAGQSALTAPPLSWEA